jgi:hypothetical protein
LFRAVNVNATRIKVLKALLHEAPINKDRTLEYDEIIDEFEAISKIRNSYVHGLWYTHDSGTVYIAVASVDDFSFFEKREIGVEEIKGNIERLAELWQRIMKLTVYDRGKLHVGDKS